MNIPILSLITFLPLFGAFLIMTIRGSGDEVSENARSVALWTSVINFLLSLFVWLRFDRTTADFQFTERYEWLPWINIDYYVGIDGISLLFLLLSTFLVPICIIASKNAIKTRVLEYMVAFLLLETMIVGTFCALDMFLFYVFFEGVLIPMFIIIGIWGGKRRVYAAFKLFLFTFLGSVLMLVAMLFMYFNVGVSDITVLMNHDFPLNVQQWLWWAFFASFAVKLPMFPVHTWLPDAHVEAPTGGSVILAGILLKFGAYGFLRFSLPMFPEASAMFTPLVYILSTIAVVYTSLIAFVQTDMKKLIAYSSIAHMGFVTAGMFSGTIQGIEGAIFQSISHGLVAAALFLIVGVLYDRVHSREIADYGGLVHRMPKYAVIFMIFMMASIGLPSTSGFVGEFLILSGVFRTHILLAAMIGSGVILGAGYMLYLYRRVIFGELTLENLKTITDLKRHEIIVFIPLVVLTLWAGIYPSLFLDVMHVSVMNLIEQISLTQIPPILEEMVIAQ